MGNNLSLGEVSGRTPRPPQGFWQFLLRVLCKEALCKVISKLNVTECLTCDISPACRSSLPQNKWYVLHPSCEVKHLGLERGF